MKKLLLIIALILLTGCTAQYRVNFVDDTFDENIVIYSPDTTTYNDVKNEKYPPIKAFTYGVDNLEEPVKNDGVEYYNLSAKNNNVYLDYKFNISDFQDSYLANICYDYFKVFEEEDDIVISTDSKFKCFLPGRNLEKVDIIITTNHEVLFNNADEVNNDEYIWHITKDKKDKANIQISFSKEVHKTAIQMALSNYTVRVVLIIVSILALIIVLSLIIRVRYKQVNKI